MKRVIAPRGLPGSGKSTWVAERLAADPRSARINNDDLVAASFTGGDRKERGRTLYRMRRALLRAFLADDGIDTVYLDNTNLNVHTLNDLQMVALEQGASFEVVDDFLAVPVDECIARDATRPEPVGESVIRTMHERQARRLGPWKPRDYPPVMPYVNDPALPSCWLFDIDGTLAIRHPDRGIYDLSTVGLDWPNTPVVLAAAALHDAGEHIIVMSGRDSSAREDTQAWLLEHLGFAPPLHMRPAGDVRPDYVVKHELFTEHIADIFHVIAVLDDRDQVVNLWRRRLQVPTFQVADGDF